MESILVHLPSDTDLSDPDATETSARNLRLVETWDPSVVGIIGWSAGGLDALRSARDHPEVERLAIVATPFPHPMPDDVDLAAIAMKTLLVYGAADPATGSHHGRRWQRQLPDGRLEMVPGAGHDLLLPMWGRLLSHLAPRRKRSHASPP